MFRILLAAFLGSLLVSCSNGYKIDGKTSVSCLDGRMFYLMTFSKNSTVIDSAEIVHGQFEMEGNLDSSMLAMAFMDNRLLMPVVLEDGHINIDISFEKMTVTGTPLNEQLYAFFEQKRDLDKRIGDMDRRIAQLVMDGCSVDAARAAVRSDCDGLFSDYDSMIETFITSNFDNVLSKCIFLMLYGNNDSPKCYKTMKDILDKAPDDFREDVMIREFMARVD